MNYQLEAIAGSVGSDWKDSMGKTTKCSTVNTACIVEFLKETTGKANVKYDAVDPTQVTKSDIIGGYSVSTHKTTGLELINSVFPRFTKVPDLILCPNWSHDPEVAAVMSAKAENINGLFEAEAILDVDCTEGNRRNLLYRGAGVEKEKEFHKENGNSLLS